MIRLPAFALLAFIGCGCNRSPVSAHPGTCMRERDNACVAYDSGQSALGKRMCAGHHWNDGETSCPTVGRIGRCDREGGKIVETIYGGPPNNYSQAAAKSACEWGGGRYTAE